MHFLVFAVLLFGAGVVLGSCRGTDEFAASLILLALVGAILLVGIG